MAYIIDSAIDLRHNLKYEFVGGDTNKAIDGLIYDGRRLRGSGIQTCFRFNIPIPDELMSAVPRRIVVAPCKDGFVPDFGYAAQYGCYVISNRGVDVLERLESGVHQYLEIPECVTNNGDALDRRFYLLYIRTRLPAVDIERSFVYWHETEWGSRLLMFKPGPGNHQKLVLKRTVIAGHHLWQGSRDQFATLTFCSEALRLTMSEAGLSEMRFRWCEEAC